MKQLPAISAAFLRGIATLLSPSGSRAALIVLMYHRVLAEPDPLLSDEPDAERFSGQMDLVRSLFRVVDLADGVAALQAGTLPARCAAITFDDGYMNNVEIAAPILKARGMTATFFVATGFLDGSAMWNDIVIEAVRRAPDRLDLREIDLGQYELPDLAARRRTVDELLGKLKYLDPDLRLQRARTTERIAGGNSPRGLMLDAAGVRKLVSLGMSIGAHSVSHPILAGLTEEAAWREIYDSKRALEAVLRSRVRTFAYPNGRPQRDYRARDVKLVRAAGYEAAVSTAWGAAIQNCDPHQIPRLAPWDRDPSRFALRLLRGQWQRSAATAS